jgi:U3 small nucleolar RNA-associated protein 14
MLERRAELAKLRALLFFKEQKQKKIAKIKSKTYRKIAKKAAQRSSLSVEELNALDPERAKEEQHRLEFERAKERMTLKHKNTGKWAKRMLGRNDTTGSETHKALMEQLEVGERLRLKIEGIQSESDGNYSGEDGNVTLDALEELQSLRQEVETTQVSTQGLFSMKFMQRGMEAQIRETKEAILEAEKDFTEEGYEDKPIQSSYSNRHVFAKNANVSDETGEDFGDKISLSDDEFQIRSNKISISSKPLFHVDSFLEVESEGSRIDPNLKDSKDGMQTKEIPESKPPSQVFVALENDLGFDNPWLAGLDPSSAKKSIHKEFGNFEKNKKSERSYAKSANARKNHLENETEDVEVTLDPVMHHNDSVFTDKDVFDVNQVKDAQDITTSDIMSMAFAHDDIGKVCLYCNIRTLRKKRQSLPSWKQGKQLRRSCLAGETGVVQELQSEQSNVRFKKPVV